MSTHIFSTSTNPIFDFNCNYIDQVFSYSSSRKVQNLKYSVIEQDQYAQTLT